MPEVKTPVKKTLTSVLPAKTTATVAVPGKKKGEVREIKFPRFKAMFCCKVPEDHTEENGSPVANYDGPITVARAKELLGWETEDEYAERRLATDPTLKESKLKFGMEYTLKDGAGNKVKCWNNSTNRPLNLEHCKKLRQDVLTGDWQMNCESIIVSRTGIVLSGQHRLICLILAWEEWKKQAKWQQLWEGEEPYIESLVVFGASDDPAVLKTFDNVMPRSLGDVYFTSPLFFGKSTAARVKMTDMMARGVKLLWLRLNAESGGFIEKQTHSASLDFSDRHQRLVASVKHIHDEMGEESGNVFATMKLHTGACAAMLYLMGQSGSSVEQVQKYHALGSPHEEKQLDWKRWDRALEFWSEMSKTPDAEKLEDRPAEWVLSVRGAISALEGESGRGGTPRQRHAIVAMAWTKFYLKEEFKNQTRGDEKGNVIWHDLWPKMELDEERNRRVISAGEEPIFGGADLGEQYDEENDGDSDVPNPEAVRERAEREREQKAKDAVERKIPTITADPIKKVIPNPTPKANGALHGWGGVKVKGEEPVAKTVQQGVGRGANNEIPKKPKAPVQASNGTAATKKSAPPAHRPVAE